jgi:cholinesterase
MRCMRSQSTESITAAIPTSNTSPLGSASFWPTIDEVVVFSDYPNRTPASIPILIGTADYEFGFHRAIASLFDQYLPDATWEFYDNIVFQCPAARRANVSIAAGHGRGKAWRYRYFGAFEDLRMVTSSYGDRAYHGEELTVLFGTLPSPQEGIPAPTKYEIDVGKYIRGAWATFAKDPEDGLRCYGGEDGWPVYNPQTASLIRLARDGNLNLDAVKPEVYDSVC